MWHRVGAGSCLVLHTINGRLVASIHCTDLIHCLTFSPAAEGRAVNVIAGGMSTGKIRFVKCWTWLFTDILDSSQKSAVRFMTGSCFLKKHKTCSKSHHLYTVCSKCASCAYQDLGCWRTETTHQERVSRSQSHCSLNVWLAMCHTFDDFWDNDCQLWMSLVKPLPG